MKGRAINDVRIIETSIELKKSKFNTAIGPEDI